MLNSCFSSCVLIVFVISHWPFGHWLLFLQTANLPTGRQAQNCQLFYLSLISATLHPCGTIGNTLFSLVTITSNKYGPLWSSISCKVAGKFVLSEIDLPAMP